MPLIWFAIKEHIRLALMSASTTFIPWMLPLTYAAIVGLQTQGANPLTISIITITGAIIGTSCLRFLNLYASERLKKNIKIPDNRKTGSRKQTKKSRIREKTERLHDKLHMVKKKRILFWIVALTTYSAIPDILIIGYTQKKLPLPLFLIATVIGKTLVYLPVIYGVELVQLLF